MYHVRAPALVFLAVSDTHCYVSCSCTCLGVPGSNWHSLLCIMFVHLPLSSWLYLTLIAMCHVRAPALVFLAVTGTHCYVSCSYICLGVFGSNWHSWLCIMFVHLPWSSWLYLTLIAMCHVRAPALVFLAVTGTHCYVSCSCTCLGLPGCNWYSLLCIMFVHLPWCSWL